MDKIFIVGIDPGKNGGITSITNGKITTIDDMPKSPGDLWEHFLFLGFPHQPEGIQPYVFIEQVHSMPTDGVRAAFTFGYNTGQLHLCVDRLCDGFTFVLPSKWMAHFDLKRDKQETKYAYKKRIVETARSKTKKVDVASITLKTADAYLIALYGYHLIKQKQKNNEN